MCVLAGHRTVNFHYFTSLMTPTTEQIFRTIPLLRYKGIPLTVIVVMLVVASCRVKKEAVYRWEGTDESRSLTLRRDNSFILEIDAGYYFRVDTGTFTRKGDTLVINPDKGSTAIDSLLEMDTLFNGHRFLEVMIPVIDFGTDNQVEGFRHTAVIFPAAVVNDTLPLVLDPDDASLRKLRIPDSLRVRSLAIKIPEKRTCKPELNFRLALPQRDPPTSSYRVYLRSHDTKPHYLAGYKWLIRGDTVMTSFLDEDCVEAEVKLVRVAEADY